MSLIQVENVTKRYFLGGPVQALHGVTLAVQKGEFLVIIGPSGSGKTSLLNIIGLIERPSSGTIRFDGQDVTGLSQDELAETRAHDLGYIFQTFNLLPVLTVAENVEFALRFKRLPGRERRARVMRALEEVGMAKYAQNNPRQLSGGQRQRTAIARALVGEPKVILADEPTANLDFHNGAEVLRLMKALNKCHGITFVFSTHDQKVMSLAGRIVELADGVLQEGEIRND